jgi:hypothetical protein
VKFPFVHPFGKGDDGEPGSEAQERDEDEDQQGAFAVLVVAAAPPDDALTALATQNRDADIANLEKFNTAMYDLASSSVDRARSGAELVQKASAAIATLYGGVLALVFSVTENPLPVRGLLTPFFLGLAVVLSTIYIAYLRPATGFSSGSRPAVGPEPKSFQRLNTFLAVTSTVVTRRSGFLRASVISLGVGLVFIAAPFIGFAQTAEGSQSLPTSPSWPTPSPKTSGEPDKLLFAAQLKEVADARAKARKNGDRTSDVIALSVGLVVGLIAVAWLPHLARGASSPGRGT